jgi:hypothetical protein
MCVRASKQLIILFLKHFYVHNSLVFKQLWLILHFIFVVVSIVTNGRCSDVLSSRRGPMHGVLQLISYGSLQH